MSTRDKMKMLVVFLHRGMVTDDFRMTSDLNVVRNSSARAS